MMETKTWIKSLNFIEWKSRFQFPFFIFIVFSALVACKNATNQNHHQAELIKYTCPMHPKVIAEAPGRCPICGMDLVAVNGDNSKSNDMMLSDSQMRLANIITQKVSMQPVGQTVAVNGRLAENEELTEVVSSRAGGRVEKLFVKETGRAIKRGEPLYELYSETLLTLQKEYLLAKEQFETLGETEKRFLSFLKAAERKLLLYGLAQKQIDELGESKNVRSSITFFAPASGIVTDIRVSEGQYVPEGGLLFQIENISKLWVEAELYPAETSLVNLGDKITVRVAGFENWPAEVTISFLSPEYRLNSVITKVRGTIDNPDMIFKPGMQAQILFTHSASQALAVPVNAVIRDGKGAHVFVQKGKNTFRPQMVKTGLENFDRVEITDGLNEGDSVAISGAYLLYSEIVLKKGQDLMAGHNH